MAGSWNGPGSHVAIWLPLLAGAFWVSDGLGILTVAPALLALGRYFAGSKSNNDRAPLIQTCLFSLVVGGACYFIFFRSEPSYALFSVFALVLIATAWLGPLASRVAALVICSMAIWATHLGTGAFAGGSLGESVENLLLFLAAVSLTGMALGAWLRRSNWRDLPRNAASQRTRSSPAWPIGK